MNSVYVAALLRERSGLPLGHRRIPEINAELYRSGYVEPAGETAAKPSAPERAIIERPRSPRRRGRQ